MIVNRWQARELPTKEQIFSMFEIEGLQWSEEVLEPHKKTPEHRQPFDEVRIIFEGELLCNVAGNQLLLRKGDRIEIPANTKHFLQNNSDSDCISIVAQRPY